MSNQYQPAPWATPPPTPLAAPAASDATATPQPADPPPAVEVGSPLPPPAQPVPAAPDAAPPPVPPPPAEAPPPARPDPVAEYRARMRALTGADPMDPELPLSPLRAVQDEDADWARWEFDAAQGSVFFQAEARRLLLQFGTYVLGALLLLGLAFGGVVREDSTRLSRAGSPFLLLALALVAVILAYPAWRLLMVWRGPRLARVNPYRVIVSPRCQSLQSTTQELRAARLIPGSPLCVVFKTLYCADTHPRRQ